LTRAANGLIPRHMKALLFAITATATILAAPAHASHSQCPDPATARVEVEQTIRQFFDALRTKDTAPFKQVTTEGFYAYDVGARFDGRELADLIAQTLENGVEINWNLGPMDTKVRCDVAWSQWENTGSAGSPLNVKPARWLESAVLVHEDGRWKVDFLHSQRAPVE
jgi:hypothetical protein